jgi:predicted permease
MERLIQDIRFAARLLWRDRGFASAAILTLALCIGANGAIFAVINSVLLRPLAVPEPERLVVIYNSYPRAGVLRASNAVPDYYDRLRETDVFEELAPYNTRGVTIGIDGQPQRVLSMVARPSLLRMLRVQPVRGRIFTEDDGEIGREQKVVLTYSAWHQLFGAQESAIGSQLRINGVPHEVVGVLPAGFQFLSPDVRFWTPLAFSADDRSDNERHSNDWSMVGRLRPGATIAVAGQQIDALNARNLERFPDLREILTNAGFHTVVKPLQQDLVENVRGTLLLLWGGVVVVLLIGGVNITNLVLIRSTARLRELATRHALGAGIGRLTRQLLTETILLTIAGGVVGLAVGHYGLGLLSTVGIDRLPRGGEVRMDATAVAFTLGLACAAGIVLGLVPAVNVRRMNLSQAFREDGRSGTTGRGTRAVRRLLVASQVAFAFMLLAGAGVLVASFDRVLAIDPGFEPHGVLTARISAPASRYPQNSDLRSFGDRVLESMRAVPGVQQAALASNVPFGGDYTDGVILAEGYQMAAGESVVSPYRVAVSPGYFDALGIGLKAGRTFTASDTAESQPVVIVDERLARRFWLGANPVGRRMYRPGGAEDVVKPGPNARWLTVVGVVEEVRIAGLVTANDRGGAYYLPRRRTCAATSGW